MKIVKVWVISETNKNYIGYLIINRHLYNNNKKVTFLQNKIDKMHLFKQKSSSEASEIIDFNAIEANIKYLCHKQIFTWYEY